MLNEKKEYELYLSPGYGKLLTNENVANGLSGLRHVLTVLARGFLSLLDDEGICSLDKKDALCHEFLFCWIHEKYTLPDYATKRIKEEFARAQNASLLRHIVNGKIKVKKFGGCEKAEVEKALQKKVAEWKNSLFFSLSENSVNEIKVRAIVADALLYGPLTNKKLVIKNDTAYFGIECSPDHTQYIDRLLAIVAACLQRRDENGRGAVVKMCELANYIDKPANNKGGRSSPLSAVDGYFSTNYLTYKGEPILTKQPITGGVLKVFFNEKWLEDFGVRLIDEGEKVLPPYTVLGDFDLLKGRF